MVTSDPCYNLIIPLFAVKTYFGGRNIHTLTTRQTRLYFIYGQVMLTSVAFSKRFRFAVTVYFVFYKTFSWAELSQNICEYNLSAYNLKLSGEKVKLRELCQWSNIRLCRYYRHLISSKRYKMSLCLEQMHRQADGRTYQLIVPQNDDDIPKEDTIDFKTN